MDIASNLFYIAAEAKQAQVAEVGGGKIVEVACQGDLIGYEAKDILGDRKMGGGWGGKKRCSLANVPCFWGGGIVFAVGNINLIKEGEENGGGKNRTRRGDEGTGEARSQRG